MTPKANRPSPITRVLAACVPWWPVLVLVLILMALGVMSAIKAEAVAKARRSQRKKGPPPVNVVTLTVGPTLIRDRLTLPGEVLAHRELAVPAEVPAVLGKKTKKEGAAVQAGEILARLDTSRYAARLRAAEAAFESARATARRLRNLNRTSLATQSDLDRAEAGLEEARTARTTARLDLSKCEIRAPFSGYLDDYLIEEGAFVTGGTPICRLVELDPIKIRVGVPESDVRKARDPAAFSVVIDALGEAPLAGGTLLRLARSAGNTARLYDLDLLFPNEKKRILPDMFARVELIKEVRPRALVIPLYALSNQKDTQVVFLEEKGQAVMRPVKTGIQEGWRVEVTEGLEPGDRVIVVGQRFVSQGRKVNVVRRLDNAGELNP